MEVLKQIPTVSLPFATLDVNRDIAFGNVNESDIREWMLEGFSPKLGSPQTEKASFTRHHLNKLGFAATIGCFLDQCGYQPGFKHMPIGGWPKGAIITEVSNDRVKEYLNTIENNEVPPEASASIAESSNYWVPIYGFKDCDFFPDYTASEELLNESYPIPRKGDGWNNADYKVDLEITQACWIKVTCRWGSWESLFTPASIERTDKPRIEIGAIGDVGIGGYQWLYNISTINILEGQTAIRLFPMPVSQNTEGRITPLSLVFYNFQPVWKEIKEAQVTVEKIPMKDYDEMYEIRAGILASGGRH